jgi:hypothetical protein
MRPACVPKAVGLLMCLAALPAFAGSSLVGIPAEVTDLWSAGQHRLVRTEACAAGRCEDQLHLQEVAKGEADDRVVCSRLVTGVARHDLGVMARWDAIVSVQKPPEPVLMWFESAYGRLYAGPDCSFTYEEKAPEEWGAFDRDRGGKLPVE